MSGKLELHTSKEESLEKLGESTVMVEQGVITPSFRDCAIIYYYDIIDIEQPVHTVCYKHSGLIL